MTLIEYKTTMEELWPVFQERLVSGQKVKFAPNGISMLPMLRQGIDSVVLSPVPEKLQKYDLPLYRRQDGKYILHRVIDVNKDVYTCIGDNLFQFEYGITHDCMLAIVTSFYRGEKEYSVSDWRYQLYCRVWDFSRPVRYFYFRAKRWMRRHLKI